MGSKWNDSRMPASCRPATEDRCGPGRKGCSSSVMGDSRTDQPMVPHCGTPGVPGVPTFPRPGRKLRPTLTSRQTRRRSAHDRTHLDLPRDRDAARRQPTGCVQVGPIRSARRLHRSPWSRRPHQRWASNRSAASLLGEALSRTVGRIDGAAGAVGTSGTPPLPRRSRDRSLLATSHRSTIDRGVVSVRG